MSTMLASMTRSGRAVEALRAAFAALFNAVNTMHCLAAIGEARAG